MATLVELPSEVSQFFVDFRQFLKLRAFNSLYASILDRLIFSVFHAVATFFPGDRSGSISPKLSVYVVQLWRGKENQPF